MLLPVQSQLSQVKKHKKKKNIESETRFHFKAKKLKKLNRIKLCCVFLKKKNSDKQPKINSKPRFFLLNQIQIIRQLQRFCEFHRFCIRHNKRCFGKKQILRFCSSFKTKQNNRSEPSNERAQRQQPCEEFIQ